MVLTSLNIVSIISILCLSLWILFLTIANKKLRRAFEKHKMADKAIQISEKRFRDIIEDVTEISIQGYDEDHRVIFWNPASEKLYGYSEKEASGKKLEELIIPHKMRDQVNSHIEQWLQHGVKIAAGEIDLIDKGGNTVSVFSSHVMLETPQGKEMFCIDINLTPIRQTEEALRKNEEFAMVGRIAGKMAHDFNNILGVIMGNTELALLDCRDDETIKTLKLIFEQTLRGKNLTKNLIVFAKGQEPKQEFFRINEKIDLVISLLKNDFKGIELLREENYNLPELYADPGMIEHTLINLIQNAIHATGKSENPGIIVRTYLLDKTICFEIEDNGCGIPEEYLDKIYEPAFTLKGNRDLTASYKADVKGIGYGLANVKKYIEQHKGTISIESDLNKGTKAIVSLPLIKKN